MDKIKLDIIKEHLYSIVVDINTKPDSEKQEQHDNKKEIKSPIDILHRIYSVFMFVVILISLLPLTIRETNDTLETLDLYCVWVFIFDYVVRWITYDIKIGAHSANYWRNFIKYPFTGMAIVDLLSILPTFTPISNTFSLCRISRLVKTVRLVKITRTSRELDLFFAVIAERYKILLSIFGLVIVYVVFAALLMFNIDTTFDTFLDAVYWVATSNNDIIPHSRFAQVISMISSIVGVSVIALPSCIITASYINKLKAANGVDCENNSLQIQHKN